MHALPLGRKLAGRGNRVLWWTTSFDHFSKQWTFRSDSEMVIGHNFTASTITGLGYGSNTSIRRIVDHRIVARRWKNLASVRSRPDLIVAAMPPHDLAFQAIRFASCRGIPSVLDLRDPWPDALLEVAPSWIRPAARLLLFNDYRMLRRSISQCDSLIGVTASLLEWGQRLGHRAPSSSDRVFYTGARPVAAETPAPAVAELIQKLSGAFVVVFVGSFGFFHSPFVAIDAAHQLSGTDIHFIIAGDGDSLVELRARAAGLHNVHFTGWLSATDAAAVMGWGSVGICPASHPGLILPNKAAAYFREGLPVVSSFDGDLRRLIDDRRVGLNCEPGDVEGFMSAILRLRRDETLRASMSANARRLYLERFDADANLDQLADHLELVARRSFVAP